MTVFTDLALLRGFVAIVDSGSISAAARTLHLTQPTLSRQLRALEDQCGTALLRRDTHKMSLTDAGDRLLTDAQALLSLAEEAEQRLRSDLTAISGNIRVFATIDFGQSVVSRLIASFIQAHPGVTIELAYSNRPLHMIEEGCDAGIIAGSVTDERVAARSLGWIKRYPVASPSFVRDRARATKPLDLREWPWLTLSSTQFGGARKIVLYMGNREETFPVRPIMISEGVTSIREAARMGLGIAVLPEWLIQEDLISGRLVRVLPKWQARELAAQVVFPVQRRLPLRVRAFVDFVTEYMKAVLEPRVREGARSLPGAGFA